MAPEGAELTRAERTQLAALLAAAIVASEAEGARPQPHGETTGARGERESRR